MASRATIGKATRPICTSARSARRASRKASRPACTEACPHGATIFGTRASLIAEAWKRIHENPSVYKNFVFGEKEIGGTSVLYISDIPLGFLAYKESFGDDEPLPKRTWQALKKVPWMIGGVGVAMTGIYWVIGRRMQHQAQRAMEAMTIPACAGSGVNEEGVNCPQPGCTVCQPPVTEEGNARVDDSVDKEKK